MLLEVATKVLWCFIGYKMGTLVRNGLIITWKHKSIKVTVASFTFLPKSDKDPSDVESAKFANHNKTELVISSLIPRGERQSGK